MTTCCIGNAGNGGYDLAVVGAGSAGFSAAITAAEQGARVALIGHGTIGGTCVNVGCVPSKTLIRAAESLHRAEAAARFAGIRGEARLDDWRSLVAQKDELVAGLRQAKYVDLLPAYNTVAYIDGRARLTREGVRANGGLLNVGKTIVTTGAAAARPSITGIDDIDYLTSTTALELDALPRTMLVIGGGYIGCELAQLFARAGVRVMLACRSRLLPEGEPEVSEALAGYLRDEGIDVRTGLTYRQVRRTSSGVALIVEADGAEYVLEAGVVLAATGRRPNTEGLGLSDVDVALTESGGVRVDEHLRTTNRRVYAAGDVTGRHQFVYMAAYGAKLAALNALNGDAHRYDATAMPMVTFTDPQVASVGLTEAAARADGLEVKTSLIPLDAVPRALAARDTRGLIKLVADRASDRLLGAHILAPEGADSIQTAALAIRHGMTSKELGETIFPYLTMVEGLKLAAQTFDRT
ncbi:MAG TPA: mercury(II) reductase [Geminicoccaceae bacterium]|nr:mercury(II) reductase [Geminicoccaceae bacterium]